MYCIMCIDCFQTLPNAASAEIEMPPKSEPFEVVREGNGAALPVHSFTTQLHCHLPSLKMMLLVVSLIAGVLQLCCTFAL